MCGIVAGTSSRDVTEILLEGLRRLEYRGYDSAGLALLNDKRELCIFKRAGKVIELEHAHNANPAAGNVGIAHTRWATHGSPSEVNAHPHQSEHIAVVHNGIIENHDQLRKELEDLGYHFSSNTDTECIAHLLHHLTNNGQSLQSAVLTALPKLRGAYAIAAISSSEPDTVVCARLGSPLVLGIGIGEHFCASDALALRQVTDRFIYLEEGDCAVIQRDSYEIYNQNGHRTTRPTSILEDIQQGPEKGHYRHHMLKEIHEQPQAIRRGIKDLPNNFSQIGEIFDQETRDKLSATEAVQIVACGTSYHAGMVAKYWIEGIAGLPCRVEIASEFRYRKFKIQPNTLFVTLSQSGETADTLAALRLAKELNYLHTLTICNSPHSTMVRESDAALFTHAGPEIGVASTKAFTTQLLALAKLSLVLGRKKDIDDTLGQQLLNDLFSLPELVQECLQSESKIQALSQAFSDKHHALFLGRGAMWPIAMEGSLKLKEISYIHAESYPAGELKHGPLALVDDDMPVIAVAPNNDLLEKLKSNLEEVKARGGKLYVFCDRMAGFKEAPGIRLVELPHVCEMLAPLIYAIPLQLLSYYVALIKGTDVDQPRNLAKSVTVE